MRTALPMMIREGLMAPQMDALGDLSEMQSEGSSPTSSNNDHPIGLAWVFSVALVRMVIRRCEVTRKR
jgi:hypothetical protein